MTPPNPDASKPNEDDPNPPIVELDLSSEMKGGPVNWAAALAELEGDSAPITPKKKPAPAPPPPAPAAKAAPPAPPAPAAPKPAQAATGTPVPEDAAGGRKPSKLQELMNRPSMSVDDDAMAVMTELSNILSNVNAALNGVQKFSSDHPALIAPNIYRMWEDNLKETSTMMLREFTNLRHGKKARTYDKRTICKECHSVFMLPLPDGVCDECRDKPKDTNQGFY
jgi:hypothetical protein